MKRAALVLIVLALGLAFPAWSEEPGSISPQIAAALESHPEIDPSTLWGTSNVGRLTLARNAFVPVGDVHWGGPIGNDFFYRTSGSAQVACAEVHLPGGALMTGVWYYYNDSSTTGRVNLRFYHRDILHETSETLIDWDSSIAGSPGYTLEMIGFDPDVTINNILDDYYVCVVHSEEGSALQSRGVTIFYQLQVSPAPSVATFSDVPTTSAYFRYVEALYDTGIVSGCTATTYCPNNPVTRGQMAVFLASLLGLNFP